MSEIHREISIQNLEEFQRHLTPTSDQVQEDPIVNRGHSKHSQICHQCHSDISNHHSSKGSLNRITTPKNLDMLETRTKSLDVDRKYHHRLDSNHQKQPSRQKSTDADLDGSSYSHLENGESDSHRSIEVNRQNSHDHAMHNYSQDIHSSPSGSKHNYKKKLDLAFLYSDPLVEKVRDELVPCNQPLDTEIEFKEIQKILMQSKKQFVMRKEAVNFESLIQITSSRPQIIHISCHGDYDEKQKQFYLAFEEKDTGILDKLNEDRLKSLLGDGSTHKVQLVFVSACHSEMIGKIFFRAKVPVVVAVNSHTMILDEVCQLFARHFYFHLLDGYTPQEAFDEAQRVVKGSNIDIYSCCCAHDHKPNCKWEKYARDHGYEAAHQIHTPNCVCKNNKTLKNNAHTSQCSVYLKFKEALQKYEDLMDPDYDADLDLPSFSKHVKLCCCQPDTPHDESIKFILNGTEEARNTPIFRQRREGQLMLEADVNLVNKLPHVIDTQLLVGRNKELQKIVQSISSEQSNARLVHIYGPEGVGKSAIANYAAKYTLDRRKFPDGVYYVEIQNKYSGQGLIAKICQKLLIQNCSKEQLSEIIKTSHILILIDKCKKMIEEQKEHFNKFLKYMVLNTINAKFIVITHNKEDISDKIKCIVHFEIPELSKLNAAKLLMLAASNSPHIKKEFKTAADLAKHPIFAEKMIPLKPSVILQMAPILFEKSLDDILREKEMERKQAEEKMLQKSEIGQSQIEYGEFNWIISISYKDLEIKFQTEIRLLNLLCQFPIGLFESDIERICEINGQYGDWKKFLDAVAQGKFVQNEAFCASTIKNQRKQNFRMVITNFSEELQEHHFMAQPIVSDYINNLVLSFKKKSIFFQEGFKFLAKLSRKILRSIKYQNKYDNDITSVSAEIDLGIWRENYTNKPLTEEELELALAYNPIVKFNLYEPNFTGMLDLQLLKVYFPKLDFKNVIIQFIDEMIISTASILVMLDRIDEAKMLLLKCKEIANYYDLKFIKAKILLMIQSINIKMGKTYYELIHDLDQAEQIFYELGFRDGRADAIFLKAIALISSINAKIENFEDPTFKNLAFNPKQFERSNSEKDFSFESQKLNKPKAQFHNSNTNNQLLIKNKSAQLNPEIEGALRHLDNARKNYQQAEQEYGIAKTNLIEAELQIEKSYGCGIFIEFNPQKITKLLLDANSIFKKLKLDSLLARSLRNLAILKIRNNHKNEDFFEAKRLIDQALKISKDIQDAHQEALCSEVLNQILDKIRIHSNNVFIFAKAFPLVEDNGNDNFRVVGTFTRYPSDFRRRVIKECKKQNKVVNVKFDVLTRELLEYVKTYGCRVLHLSSDVFTNDYLCIEGKNGQIEYISISELKNILRPINDKLNVDVVVLAIPESTALAQVFVDLGVPHVVGFDFQSQFLSTFMDNVYTLPKRYDYIYDFSVEFYKNLIQEKTVNEAWKLARPRLNDGIRKVSDKLENRIRLTDEDIGRGPILFPENSRHNQKIFDNSTFDERMQLKIGHFLDTSTVRGPTNINQFRNCTPYTGRQVDTYKLIQNVSDPSVKIINLVGLEGIGKTRFIVETSYYLYTRFMFSDGIFIIDIKRFKTAEQIKLRLKEQNIGGIQSQDIHTDLQKKNILLIFDNIDTIIKYNKASFDWFLISLVQQCEQLKIILTSKKEIKPKDYQLIQKSIKIRKLKPLNDIEAVDMILSNCTRHITKEELQMSNDSTTSIHQQLQQEGSVQKCYGFPKYLEIFANYLQYHSFDKIDIKNSIPTSKKGQMKRLHKEQEYVGITYHKQNTNIDYMRSKNQDRNFQYPKKEQPVNQIRQNNIKRKSAETQNNERLLKLEEIKEIQEENKKIVPKKSATIHHDPIPEEDENLTESGHNSINKQFKSQKVDNTQIIIHNLENSNEKSNKSNNDQQKKNDKEGQKSLLEVEEQKADDPFFYDNVEKSQRGSSVTRNRASSSGGEEMWGPGRVCYIQPDGTTKCSDINYPFKILAPHDNLYKSQGQDSNETKIQKMISNNLLHKANGLGDSQFEMNDEDNFSHLQEKYDPYDVTRNNSLRILKLKQLINDNNLRLSMDNKAGFGYDLNFIDEDTLVQLEFAQPELNKIDSTTSYIDASERRSRSNSEYQDALRQSIYQRDRTSIGALQKELSESKNAIFQPAKVNEVKEEDEHTDSHVQSDLYTSQGKQDKPNKFQDLLMQSPAKSESCSDPDDFADENFDAFEHDLDEIVLGQKSLSKQPSIFTNSSGKKSDNNLSTGNTSMGFRKQKSKKEEQIYRDKQRAKQEFGARSGRKANQYKKKVKNKQQEIQEKKQTMKKSKKQSEIEKKRDIVEKLESGTFTEDQEGNKIESKGSGNIHKVESQEKIKQFEERKSFKHE